MKLVVAVVLAAVVWVAFTFWMAEWVRHSATSNAAILLVLVGYALVMVAISGGVAVLAGDRLFERGWRERLVGGAPPDVLVAPQSHVVGFSAMVVVSLIALGALSEALSDGVLAEYFEKGAKRVTLRSDDHAAKLEVLAALGEERREDKVRPAIELLDEVWRNPREDEDVRRASLAAFGAVLATLTSAVDQWRAEGKYDRWQELLTIELRTSLGPELRAARASASGPLRSDLGRLLGLLREPGIERVLLDELRQSVPADLVTEPDATWVAAVQGAMELRSNAALFAVGTEVARHRADENTVALLALATSKLASAYHLAHPTLDERTMPEAEREGITRVVAAWVGVLTGTLAQRCAAAVALQRVRHGVALEPLIAAFDQAEAEAKCATEVVDLGLRRGEALGANILLRRRLLDAIAVLSEGSPRARSWVEDRLAAARKGELERELEPILDDFLRRLPR